VVRSLVEAKNARLTACVTGKVIFDCIEKIFKL